MRRRSNRRASRACRPRLIASAEHDLLHVEAERYASNLIAAGVPTQVRRHRSVSHSILPSLPAVLEEGRQRFSSSISR